MREKTQDKIKVQFRANYKDYTNLETYELPLDEALPYIVLGIAKQITEENN